MRCMLCIKPKYKQFRPYVSFHSFPKCPIQKQVWMNICNITNQVDLTKCKICSFHFQLDCFKDHTDKRILKPDAIPTYFVKRYIRKQYLQLATEHDYSKLANLNNSCILCVKSMIKFKLGSKITLHKFPTCPERRQDWINRCQLTNQEVLPKHKLCSLHFEPTCFKSSEKKRILYQNAVPTIFEVGRYNYKRRVFKGKSKDCVKMEIACQDQ
ncbi:uncharacterized protein LOC114128760 isoform X1 [Aphis gossypii]|uniref:uncharacterized protein LOC114128760 isoform X1 n=1 Tax=Aphis gossypii TaxID=80765 RepID=UPI00100F7D92|nr:uncharacterized protein LOC114128760 isoform X1 [Aphis gossypii]